MSPAQGNEIRTLSRLGRLCRGRSQPAASVTTTLRLDTMVIDTDYRHLVLLAKEAATLDCIFDPLSVDVQKKDCGRSRISYSPSLTPKGFTIRITGRRAS